MAYTPINWQTGDTITAEKMNKMDNGWSVSSTQLFSETVTTVAGQLDNSAQLAYTGTDTPNSMTITFDSTDYACPQQSGGGQYWYGAPNPDDWSTYPFVVLYMSGAWILITETAGEHTVSASSSSLNVSDSFKTAVESCIDTSTMPMLCKSGIATFSEMQRASADGRILYFKAYGNESTNTAYITGFTLADGVFFIPEDTNIRVTFDNGVFTIINT